MIKLPSLSEDDTEPPVKVPRLEEPILDEPSTSTQTLKIKSASTMAKIRGITNEIRHLSNLSKNMKTDGKMKRPLSLCLADAMDATMSKTQQIDEKEDIL